MSDKVELDIKGYAEVRDSRPQPTASVGAEQVWREAWEAHANAWHDEVEADPDPMAAYAQRAQDAAVIAAAAVIQAYGDARADAARREAMNRQKPTFRRLAMSPRREPQ